MPWAKGASKRREKLEEATTAVPLLKDTWVKAKLILASVLGSGAALLIVGAVITSLDLIALREKLVRRMSIQADIAGANCISALQFSDSNSAGTTLAALRAGSAKGKLWIVEPGRIREHG